jgi:hypothetical protein
MQRLTNQLLKLRKNSKQLYLKEQYSNYILDPLIATNANLDPAQLAKFYTHKEKSYSTTSSAFPLVLGTQIAKYCIFPFYVS